jgi:hypothetical protein
MPSKRTAAIIGIWVVVAVVLIIDAFLFSALLLDSFLPGLSGIVNVLIFTLIPFIIASLLLDRRATPSPTTGPSRQPPHGARTASGEPVSTARPKPRIKRGKRAEQLETIVVEPGATGNSSSQTNTANSSSQESPSSSSRFLRSRRTRSEEDAEMDQQVKEQLDAIELEMAKLEEQLEQNGVATPVENSSSVPNSVNDESVPTNSSIPTNPGNSTLSSEEASSELQAIDALLDRLEQRKRAGGVEEETYQRLREKYHKRRSELT